MVGPDEGEMACGEYGPGRMAEPAAIVAAIGAALGGGPLAGRHVLVTSGPTHEPIDPVRYIANRSSGAQGHGDCGGAARSGGAGDLCDRAGGGAAACRGGGGARWKRRREMAAAVEAALPADAAVMAAAVADWRVANASGQKLKKDAHGQGPGAGVCREPGHSGHGVQRARSDPGWWSALRRKRRMSWPMPRPSGRARAVTGSWPTTSRPATGIMGGAENAVTLISDAGAEAWPRMGKDEVARKLAERIAEALR